MAMQTELTPRLNKSRANSHSHNAEAQPEIDSTGLSSVTRQVVDPLTDARRHELIAIAAYHLAEARNFEPGHDTEDWLAAEAQVRRLGREIP
jgi:hypothetical protein